MKTNPVSSPNFGTNLFVRHLISTHCSPQRFRGIIGMQEEFRPAQLDELCKTVTLFKSRIGADEHDRLAMEILGKLDVKKGLRVSGHYLNGKNAWIPCREGYIKFKTPEELKAGLEKEYSLLLKERSHFLRRTDS